MGMVLRSCSVELNEFKERKSEFLLHLKVEKNLALNTLLAYNSDLEQFISFWLHMPGEEKKHLTLRQLLERFLISLYYKKIDKSSIARKLSCFKSFERFLKTQGITVSLKFARPRFKQKLPVFLSVDEIFYLLDTVKESDMPTKLPKRDKAILELLYATGMRNAELVSVKFKDLDMENKCIRIVGKGNKERVVLFGEKAKAKLLEYFTYERPKPISNDASIFITARGKPIDPTLVQNVLAMFRKFLAVDRALSPHKIRHSFATHMLNQGADLRVIQELLGHRSLSSTERYTHVSSAKLSIVCDTLHPLNFLKKRTT